MMRFIMPIILIAIAFSMFFVVTNPIYSEISTLREEVSAYDLAAKNAKELENEKDILTKKRNDLKPDDLERLSKLLPENVDNIRLILEIEKIALPYAMELRDVKYSPAEKDPNAPGAEVVQGGEVDRQESKDYGAFDLEFSISGSYDNFINFTKDLESNLRIVDISSIDFSSDVGSLINAKTNSPEIYKYDFKIKTYWLKN